jgi:pyruvate dehydrogenase E1 component alpha subunit
MPDPSPLSAFEHIYAGPHSIVDAERQAYAAYLDSFDDAASTPVPSMAAERPAVPQARGTGGFERSGEA